MSGLLQNTENRSCGDGSSLIVSLLSGTSLFQRGQKAGCVDRNLAYGQKVGLVGRELSPIAESLQIGGILFLWLDTNKIIEVKSKGR